MKTAQGTIVTLVVCFFVSVNPAVAREPVSDTYQLQYELLSTEDVRFDGMSRMARKLVRSSDEWMVGHSTRLYVFATSMRRVSQTVEEGEFVWSWLDSWLGVSSSLFFKAHLFIVPDEMLWKRLIRGQGLRHDSLALQYKNELYLNDDAGRKPRPDGLAHELIHVRLSPPERTGGLPLWMEEGLALYLGWLCAAEYNDQKGLVLIRNNPAINAADMMSLHDLLTSRKYPDDPVKANAFYRQSDELVGLIIEKIGREHVHAWIEKMRVLKVDQPEELLKATGLSSLELDECVRRMKERCLLPQKP